jgi:hypothetical protein
MGVGWKVEQCRSDMKLPTANFDIDTRMCVIHNFHNIVISESASLSLQVEEFYEKFLLLFQLKTSQKYVENFKRFHSQLVCTWCSRKTISFPLKMLHNFIQIWSTWLHLFYSLDATCAGVCVDSDTLTHCDVMKPVFIQLPLHQNQTQRTNFFFRMQLHNFIFCDIVLGHIVGFRWFKVNKTKKNLLKNAARHAEKRVHWTKIECNSWKAQLKFVSNYKSSI